VLHLSVVPHPRGPHPVNRAMLNLVGKQPCGKMLTKSVPVQETSPTFIQYCENLKWRILEFSCHLELLELECAFAVFGTFALLFLSILFVGVLDDAVQ
jgi:hypothetical protein